MSANADHVLAFIAAWERRDLQGILAKLAPDALYRNIPMAPMKGRDEIGKVIGPFLAGATEVRWTVHHIAEDGAGVVLTERTDVFVMRSKTLSIPVMGAFELRNGLICAWRDFFDLADFQRQMA